MKRVRKCALGVFAFVLFCSLFVLGLGAEQSPKGEASEKWGVRSNDENTTPELVYVTNEEGVLTEIRFADQKLYEEMYESLGDDLWRIVTEIELPEHVTGISKEAFRWLTELRKLKAHEGITYMEGGMLSNCLEIEEITVPFIGETANDSATGYLGFFFGAESYEKNQGGVPVSLGTVNLIAAETVPAHAFYACSKLTTVNLSNGITEIGEASFYRCISLRSIDLPETVTRIQNESFFGCTRLSEVVLPAGLTELGEYAFGYCSAIKAMTLPGSLNVIREGTFYSCTALREITLPDALNSIEKQAFYGCIRLQDISFPVSLRMIGSNAFERCGALTEILLPEGVQEINGGAFIECDSVKKVIIPSGTSYIGSQILKGCDKIEALSIPFVGSSQTSTIKRKLGYLFGSDTSNADVPETLVKLSITNSSTIQSLAFENCSKIKSIDISQKTKTIELGAFIGCDGLESMTIPFIGNVPNSTRSGHFGYIFGAESETQSVSYVPSSLAYVCVSGGNYVDERAFWGCDNIKELVFLSEKTVFTQSSLAGCNNLERLTLPALHSDINGISSLGYIFGDPGKSEQSLYVPASLVKVNVTGGYAVNESAFYGCWQIKDVIFPVGLDTVEDKTFYYCTGLEAVELPETLKYIANEAFAWCESLKLVELPQGLLTIESEAFLGCRQLDKVVIPETVYYIGSDCFAGCRNITEVSLSEGLLFIDSGAFGVCTSLKEITIPDSVKKVGLGAFGGCISLEKIQLPVLRRVDDLFFIDTLAEKNRKDYALNTIILTGGTVILSQAFSKWDKLTTVVLPNTIEIIDEYAFYGCSSLSEFRVPPNTRVLGRSVFDGCGAIRELIFPRSLKVISVLSFDDDDIQRIVYEGTKDEWDQVVKEYSFKDYYERVVFVDSADQKEDVVEKDMTESSDTPETEEPAESVQIELSFLVNENGLLTDVVFADPNLFDKYYAEMGESVWALITRITIPSKVVTIPVGSLSKFSNLTYLYIPNSVQKIEKGALEACTRLEYLRLPFIGEKYTLSKNDCLGVIFGASSYTEQPSFVPASLREIVISKESEIADYAFAGCTQLEHVTIEKATRIGFAILEGCSSLRSLSVPFIGSQSKGECLGYYFGEKWWDKNVRCVPLSLESVTITGGATIEYRDFYCCVGLKHLEFLHEDVSFTLGALAKCVSLESMVIPFVGNDKQHSQDTTLAYLFKDLMYSDEYSFPYYLSDITVTHETELGLRAFAYLTSLRYVHLPETMTYIGSSAFFNCHELKDVSFLRHVDTIGGGAFSSCFSIQDIVFSDTITSTGGAAFQDCLLLERIIWGAQMKTIDEKAFEDCVSLLECDLPNTVKTIGEDAFYRCLSLRIAYLPVSITTLGREMMSQCDNLKYVIYNGDFKSWNQITKESGLYPNTTRLIVADSHDHKFEHMVMDASYLAEKPTCAHGYGYYYSCICRRTGSEVFYTDEGIMPHTVVIDEAIIATCGATGKTKGSHCSVCQEVIEEQLTIPCKPHEMLRKIPGKEATCTENGTSEGEICDACNTVTVEVKTINATGHTIGPWIIITDPTATSEGLKTKSCKSCGEVVETASIERTSDISGDKEDLPHEPNESDSNGSEPKSSGCGASSKGVVFISLLGCMVYMYTLNPDNVRHVFYNVFSTSANASKAASACKSKGKNT